MKFIFYVWALAYQTVKGHEKLIEEKIASYNVLDSRHSNYPSFASNFLVDFNPKNPNLDCHDLIDEYRQSFIAPIYDRENIRYIGTMVCAHDSKGVSYFRSSAIFQAITDEGTKAISAFFSSKPSHFLKIPIHFNRVIKRLKAMTIN